MPEISVLLCVYNGENYLNQCLESILIQSFTDFEFIIVNDGSTDRSLEILNDYSKKDTRITIINRINNAGITASVTEGVRHCHGKYIARMDQDDVSLPDRLLKQHQFLEANPNIDVVGSSLIFIDENGNFTGKTLVRPTDPMVIRLQMYYRCVIHNPSTLMRTEYYRKYNQNSIEKDFLAADDYSLWLRENSRHFYANLAEPFLLYRIHSKQTSNEKRRTQMKETIRTVELAYKELLGHSIPTEVIESFYYINHFNTTNPEIIKEGLETIYQVQKAFEKQNRLNSAQKKETRKFSYIKMKNYLAKYHSMTGILFRGMYLLASTSPCLVLQDILNQFNRNKSHLNTEQNVD